MPNNEFNFPDTFTLMLGKTGNWAEYKRIFEDGGMTPGTDPSPGLTIPLLTQLPLTLYSQRDPRWRNLIYAGGETFGLAGCYTVAVASALSLAGYTDTPPEVAEKLRNAGCYSGALLTKPAFIPVAYPKMVYDGPSDVSKDGPLRWHDGHADLERFKQELAKGPVITEVDFVPATAKFNQHFVIALRFDGDDLVIADPWDGTETHLMQRYATTDWSLARALYGVRLLRVK